MGVFRDSIGRVRSGWVVLVFAIVAVVIELGAAVALEIFRLTPGDSLASPSLALSTLATLLAGALATLVCRLAFKELTGLEHARPGREVARGFAVGVLTFVAVVSLLVVGGGASLRWAGGGTVALVAQALALAPAALGEELLLRGLAFQALRRGLGDVAAILSTGLLFGALHLMNPNASLVAAVIIALVGVWLGLAMIRARTTWFPVGMHLAWNFAEGQVFGFPVSGERAGASLFEASWGPEGLWSGGAFGPEAAGVTAIVLTLACVLTFLWRRPGDAG